MIRSKLRCAVIGTGTFAEVCHVPGLQSHPAAEVVAICGNAARARRLADKFGIADACSDAEALCARPDIDAITIATRNVDHRMYALAALRHNKHVLCEKPLAMNVAEAREMAAAANARDVVHQVAFVFRYNYGVQELRRRVRRGDIGQPFYCRVQYDNWDGLKPDWQVGWGEQQALAGGGVLFNLGSHLFDLTRHLLGPIESAIGYTHHLPRESVDARTGARIRVETDDLFNAWLRHASGVRSQLFVSRITPGFTRNGNLEVIGPDGALKAALSRGAWDSLSISTPRAPEWTDVPLPDEARDKTPHSLGLMMRSFVDACLRGSVDPAVDATFNDGLAAQIAMESISSQAGPDCWQKIEAV